MSSSIVIPVFNRLIFTRICTAMLQSTIASRPDVEVIIVDNGSTDGTSAFIKDLPEAFRRAALPRNRGFAVACNYGAELARHENLVFLNNDTVPLPGWLAPMEVLLSQADVGVVGSKLLFPDDTIQHAGIVVSESSVPVHVYYAFPQGFPGANEQRDYQAVTGACLAIRKSVFTKLGGFDEGYQNSYEDVDLCLKARTYQYRTIYCPRSVLYHFESASEGRHHEDDANLGRLLERWGSVLELDEAQWYKQDGFSSVPHLPARYLSQAITQLKYERRNSLRLGDAVRALGVSLIERGNVPRSAKGGPIPRAHATVPNPATAGSELVVALEVFHGAELPGDNESTIRFEWRLPQTGAVLLSGVAGQLPSAQGPWQLIEARLVVPTIPGRFALTWLTVNGSYPTMIGQQVIRVAPRFGVSCRAFLPDLIVVGSRYRILVVLKNTGATTWLANRALMLSYHWFDGSGDHLSVWDGLRTPIPDGVSPGEETIVDAALIAPSRPGTFRLRWDLVQDGEYWFSSLGELETGMLVEIHQAESPEAVPESDRSSYGRDLGSLARELQRRERTIASLELALAKNNAKCKDDALRARNEVIKLLEQQLAELDAHIAAIERGRVMTALNAFHRLWATVFHRMT